MSIHSRNPNRMKPTILLTVLPFALALSACRSTCAAGEVEDTAGVESAKRAFLASWTKTDGAPFTLDELSKAVDTSERFLSFDGMSKEETVIEGWRAYSAIWGPGINAFRSASLSEERPVASWIGDDTAITASIAHIQGLLPDGSPLDLRGHLTLGYEKRDGAWRVVHEHMSLGVKP